MAIRAPDGAKNLFCPLIHTVTFRLLVVCSPVGWILIRTPLFTSLAAPLKKIWTSRWCLRRSEGRIVTDHDHSFWNYFVTRVVEDNYFNKLVMLNLTFVLMLTFMLMLMLMLMLMMLMFIKSWHHLGLCGLEGMFYFDHFAIDTLLYQYLSYLLNQYW